MANIHVTAAGAALDRLPCGAAVQRNLYGCRERKITVLFQQHHALRRKRAKSGKVFGFKGLYLVRFDAYHAFTSPIH